MKRNSFILFVLMSLLIMSCQDTDTPSANSPVDEVWLHDVANDENASDLQVLFVLSEAYASKELRLILAKESPTTPVTNDHLETLESSAFTTVSTTGDLSYKLRLNQNQVDSDGDPLAHDSKYVAYVYAPDLGAFTSTTSALEFSENQVYNGKYKGDWSDNLFSGITISCAMTGNGSNVYRGPFYISGNFTPNWGATEDNGKVEMEIVDGEILSFEYSQVAPDYMGGCPGLYVGTGTVDDNFNLTVNFTGDDCDGHHEDGVMTFFRQWKEE